MTKTMAQSDTFLQPYRVRWLWGAALCLYIAIFSSNGYARSLIFVTLESPPVEYLDDGQATGINIEITQEACRRLGLACQVKIVPWKRALLMVKNGSADGIVDAARSQERETYLHYPDEELYTEQWYGFKRKDKTFTLDSDFTNAHDIAVGTSRGFVYGGSIQQALDEKRFKAIEEGTDNVMNIRKLVGGRMDMLIGVRVTILHLAKQMGVADAIDIVRRTETGEEYLLSASKTYLGFSRKTTTVEMAREFSKVLAAMKKDGTVARITSRYL